MFETQALYWIIAIAMQTGLNKNGLRPAGDQTCTPTTKYANLIIKLGFKVANVIKKKNIFRDSCSTASYLSVVGVPRLGCRKCAAYSRDEGNIQ